jgi:predicted nucleotidyltransferase
MDYDKLLNKNVIKILTVLKKKCYFNQISELSGIKSKNNLLKNLDLMVSLKVLKKEKNKSNTFYSVNYENQFCLSLLQLININKFQKLPFERRKSVLDLINEVKPLMCVLFGSSAKGNFKKESDLDLLLVFDKKKEVDIKEISSRYGVRINVIVLGFSEININDETVKHIFKTGYCVIGYNYFYEVFKSV